MANATADTAAAPPAARPAPYSWTSVGMGIAFALLLLVVSTTLAVQFLRYRVVDLRGGTADLGASLETTLRHQGIAASSITVGPQQLRQDNGSLYYFTRVEVTVPEGINATGIENVIERSLWRDGIAIAGSHGDAAERVMRLSLGSAEVGELVVRGASDPPPTAAAAPASVVPLRSPVDSASGSVPIESREWSPPQSEPAPPEVDERLAQRPARIAIIVDDGGYGGTHTDIILGLDPALTLAILPYTPHGTRLAERAAALGFEVMLHMPMENLSDTLKHEGQLNVGMPPAQIENLTKVALAQVPFAVGVNNHMGSKYTANPAAMAAFLDTVKDAGLFFIDSGTTAESVAYTAAHELGILSAARTLFLDNDDDPDAIRARLRELITLAREQGEAIGICHFRLHTATVLQEMLPQFASEGVQLVHASELVR